MPYTNEMVSFINDDDALAVSVRLINPDGSDGKELEIFDRDRFHEKQFHVELEYEFIDFVTLHCVAAKLLSGRDNGLTEEEREKFNGFRVVIHRPGFAKKYEVRPNSEVIRLQ